MSMSKKRKDLTGALRQAMVEAQEDLFERMSMDSSLFAALFQIRLFLDKHNQPAPSAVPGTSGDRVRAMNDNQAVADFSAVRAFQRPAFQAVRPPAIEKVAAIGVVDSGLTSFGVGVGPTTEAALENAVHIVLHRLGAIPLTGQAFVVTTAFPDFPSAAQEGKDAVPKFMRSLASRMTGELRIHGHTNPWKAERYRSLFKNNGIIGSLTEDEVLQILCTEVTKENSLPLARSALSLVPGVPVRRRSIPGDPAGKPNP